MIVTPTPGEASLEALPPRPVAPVAIPSIPRSVHSVVSAPITPGAEGQPAKKKRRRKKKPSGLGSSMTPIPASVPRPVQDPVAAAMSAGPVPTPVAPGERISFDA